MGTYVSVAQVTAHIPFRTISASTKPTTAQVEEWIVEGEALLDSALAAIGVTTPVTEAADLILARAWVKDYPLGHLIVAFANAGGDGDNDDGELELERFYERYNDITANPAKYAQLLAGGEGPATSRQVRSHIVDNPDAKTTANGDFLPKFTRDDFN